MSANSDKRPIDRSASVGMIASLNSMALNDESSQHLSATQTSHELEETDLPHSISIPERDLGDSTPLSARESHRHTRLASSPASSSSQQAAIAITNITRRLVSKEKIRLQTSGFDLDLTYITTQIIAMGFPAENIEGLYRNPMTEVQRYLDSKHPDHFRVYNLCSERTYDPACFHGRVAHYPFDDHNAPPFDLIRNCCLDIGDWLNRDPANVVCVHCKAGKGRTGLIICAYLLHSGVCQTAEDAMRFYAYKRTRDGKGVTIPSQKRYIEYYGDLLLSRTKEIPQQTWILEKIYISPVPIGGVDIAFKIKSHTETLHERDPALNSKFREQDTRLIVLHCGDLPLQGDVKFDFKNRVLVGKPEKLFHFWININFLKQPHLVLTKNELDSAHSDKKHKKFSPQFRVELIFKPQRVLQPIRPSSAGGAPPPLPQRPHARSTITPPPQ